MATNTCSKCGAQNTRKRRTCSACGAGLPEPKASDTDTAVGMMGGAAIGAAIGGIPGAIIGAVIGGIFISETAKAGL